jgi:hypothetical protein
MLKIPAAMNAAGTANASRRRWSQRLHCQSLLSYSGQERRRYPAMA